MTFFHDSYANYEDMYLKENHKENLYTERKICTAKKVLRGPTVCDFSESVSEGGKV